MWREISTAPFMTPEKKSAVLKPMKKKETSRFLSKLVKLVRDQTGSALVEATVLVPVLLILFLGVFEYSYVFYQQQLIEIGVRDAARYLSRTSTGNPLSFEPTW